MCRLFLSYHQSDVEDLLRVFLKKQDSEKILPGFPKIEKKCISNSGVHKDGFGFAWFDKGQWMMYKNYGIYNNDKDVEKVLTTIPSNTIVLGHMRRKSHGENEYENTHPFIYKNSIFMHHGKIIDYEKHHESILAKITPTYRKQIQGETDSEVLFYLFLSCISKPGSRKTVKKSQKDPYVYKAFVKMSRILKSLGVSWIGNIIYADQNYMLITRHSTSSCPAPSLYTSRIGITTDPFDNSSVLIPENTFLVKKMV
jgi:predicted glutamine amidotransferase